MKWFQTDSDAPNDPKIKAILRKGVDPTRGQSAAGALFLLWCYIGNHGKGDPGLGVRSDGSALSLEEMADECHFDNQADLSKFLDLLADKAHIHPDLWQQKGIVFLPAMWDRVSGYYRGKGKKVPYEVATEVAEVAMRGPRVATGKKKRTKKALQTKPTDQTLPTDQNGKGNDLLADAGPDKVQLLVELWNTERKPGPRVQQVTPKRRTAAARRLKEQPDLNTWRQAIQWLNRQKWCNASGDGDHPNWRADFDYLIRQGTLVKVLEQMAVDGAGDRRDASKGRTGTVKPGHFADALKRQEDDETAG